MAQICVDNGTDLCHYISGTYLCLAQPPGDVIHTVMAAECTERLCRYIRTLADQEHGRGLFQVGDIFIGDFMRCVVKYSHPVTGNTYRFIRFHLVGDRIMPIGCHKFIGDRFTVFKTKAEAITIGERLRSLGYRDIYIVPAKRYIK